MLDFMYHGEYDIGIGQKSATGDDDDAPTKLDVLSHLFCYAIAESYQVQELSNYALKEFADCLHVVSPDDFAELMGVIAAHTEAKPVHAALRNVASDRQDELADCKKFVRILGCKHILEQPSLAGEAASDLRAAKQLAVHGATMFRIANRMKSVAAVEKNQLVRMYQEALQKIEQLRLQVDSHSSTIDPDEQARDDAEKEKFVRMYHAALQEIDQLRSQVDKDSSTLVLDEQAHNDANLALQASEATANQAREELFKAEERAVRTAQAMQKMKLELEVLRNAEHNNKYNLEKATKEVATLRLALEGCEKSRDAEVATLSVALEASQLHAVNEQRKAADAQRATAQQEKMAAELAAARKRAEIAEEGQRGAARGVNRVKNEFFASQASLAKTKQELVAATATVTATRYGRDQLAEEQRATARTLEQVREELHELRLRHEDVVAENKSLQSKSKRDQNALSEGAKMLTAATSQNQAMGQQVAETASLKAEVNQARLNNFTLQRSIYDLQYLILNDAENRQLLLECGPPTFVPQ
jgi:chromosome segregation ATPase